MSKRGALARAVQKAGGAAHTKLYRATGGSIGGRMGKAPVLLLTATGRKSGQPRTQPLLYLEDGDRLVLVASNGGADSHPAWFLNLEASPEAEVQIGREMRPVRARRATQEERAVYWPRLLEMWRSYDSYAKKTTRNIPVVVLEAR